MELSELQQGLQSRLTSASGLQKARILFDIEGLGALLLEDNIVGQADASQDADTRISIARDDLEALLAGRLNPALAFMTGKLRVSGNMSFAMQLQSLLED